jgi:gliding motility-associated-like protein
MNRLALIVFLASASLSQAQNLVKNNSFENSGYCPIATPIFDEFAEPWTSYSSTPDYYHPCGFPGSDSATNNSLAFDGQGFMGIRVFGESGGVYERDYIHGELSEPLDSGKFYRVTFYVRPRNNDLTQQSYGIDKMGLLLTDTVLDTITLNGLLDFKPQVLSKTIISQVNYWTSVCGIIKAKGGERYITIGNFFTDNLTNVEPLENSSNPTRGYMMVDYVEVVENDIPQLPPDTVICQEGRIDLRIAGPNISVMWSNESIEPDFIITRPGLYTAAISNGYCTYVDTIIVEEVNCLECLVYAPTAFSPNNDGLNDFFTITPNCYTEGFLTHYELTIFDKWGRKVFESISPDTPWNGSEGVHGGVYTYTLEYRFNSERKTESRIKRGFVTIIK